jgi:endonuclease YncB( thermonuclease family)
MNAPSGWKWITIGRTALAIGLGSLALGLQFARAVEPNNIRGHAAVISGDALNIGEHYIRLDGIDAPAFSQTCHVASNRSRC